LAKPEVLGGLGRLVPKHLNVERLGQIVLLAGSRQPLLYECTQESLLLSVMKAAELGVSCSGSMARGYLVPYWSNKVRGYEAQLIIGYGGLIDIICEPGGNVSHVTAEVVFAEDRFDFEMGSEQFIHHKPDLASQRRNEDVIAAYLIAWMRNGQGQFMRVMPLAEILQHRERSSSRNKQKELVGPWVSDFVAMCRKTVVRACAQYLPLSKEQIQKIEEVDEPINYDEPIEATVLQPTQGREKWGFDATKEALNPAPPEGATEPGQPDDPTTGLNDPPTELFNQGEDPGWVGVRDLFKANCEAKGMAEDQKSEAWDRMTTKHNFFDWPELDTPDKCRAVKAWIHKMIPVKEKGK